MARIVDVVVIDLTRPVQQKGFKKVALIDFTTAVETKTVTDVKELSGTIAKVASSYFGNGGGYLTVGGVDASETSDGTEITTLLNEVLAENTFYGLSLIMPKEKQKIILEKVKEFCDGNELLCVTEIIGTKEEVTTASEGLNSDRVALFASNAEETTGLGAGVCGMGFPQNEGSLTWANKQITGVPVSGYSISEENALLEKNINYLTEELGYIITQFGRTTSGSNIDITRSKDWLKNRIREGLTYALVNAKKIPFTNKGLQRLRTALDQIGVQAMQQDMLASYTVFIPDANDIPVADKAARVLRNCVFTAQLSGAVEKIEIEVQITL